MIFSTVALFWIEFYLYTLFIIADVLLGDVVYAALPDEGDEIFANSECGAIGT